MSFAELHQKYEDFLNHDQFPEIEKQAEFILQHPDLNDLNRKVGNWTYNWAFLSAYFETPKKRGLLIQAPYRFTIIHDGIEVVLNTNDAPNFRDQHEYISWLHKQIYK